MSHTPDSMEYYERVKAQVIDEVALLPDDLDVLKGIIKTAWINRQYQQESLGEYRERAQTLLSRNAELEIAIRVVLGLQNQ